MSFLKDDEFFLLMDIAATASPDPLRVSLEPEQRYHHIDEEGLKALAGAGIRTTLPFQLIWKETETAPGVYDWSYLDGYVERARRVGLKTILFTTTCGYPDWMPDWWFVKTATGAVHREALSPWVPEAMQANEDFIRLQMQHFQADDILVASAQLTVGETVLLNEAAFYDDAAVASYRYRTDSEDVPDPADAATNEWLMETYLEMLVRQQTLLANNPNHEIFVMLHPAISDFGYYGNGNKWITEILHELKRSIPEVSINHIYYTWVQWQNYWQRMGLWRMQFQENVFGGAEYAEGLKNTTPLAIEQGLRGQIIAPCYPGIHDHVEPWMVEEVKAAQALWMAARSI